MGTNTAYYAAEDRAREVINTMPEAKLRRALEKAIIRESQDWNRALFDYIGVDELAFTDGKAAAAKQEG